MSARLANINSRQSGLRSAFVLLTTAANPSIAPIHDRMHRPGIVPQRLLCEAVSSPPGETGLGSQKSIETTLGQSKNQGGAKKDLQICGAGRKSRKRPALAVGMKPDGKYQLSAA